MTAVLREHGATRIQVSRNESERLRFWSGRKNAFPAAGRISPDYYCMDGTIPRRAIGRCSRASSRWRHATVALHQRLPCRRRQHASADPLQRQRSRAVAPRRAVRRGDPRSCVEFGGTVTGEHGVGIEKINSMCVQFSPQERDAFFAVKRAFDPAGLLNPDKAIPTRARCAEYGRSVRGGLLPHPDLPRF
jgi:glycolate oxidase